MLHNLCHRSPIGSTASCLGSTGGVLTGTFAKFVAEEQKAEALTLKQQRLFAEEDEKRKNQKSGGKP